MALPNTLRDIPVAVAERTSRTLTRRFEYLEEHGLLNEVHLFDLHCIRITVDLCELRLGRDPKATPPWIIGKRRAVEIPTKDALGVLDFPLGTDKDFDFAKHFLLTGARMFYMYAYRANAKSCRLDPDSFKDMQKLLNRYMRLLRKEVDQLLSESSLSTNVYLGDLIDLQDSLIVEMQEMMKREPTEGLRAFVPGAMALRARHNVESIQRFRPAILNPIAYHPPGLLILNWWLEEIDWVLSHPNSLT